MYFRGRVTCQSWSWLSALWHISNGYRNEWTSGIIITETIRHATQKGRNSETTEDEMKAFLGMHLLWVWISYHLWKTICQQTNVSEMNSFKMSWQEQGFSPSNRIFTFPITTMIIKLINRTKSVLSSNI